MENGDRTILASQPECAIRFQPVVTSFDQFVRAWVNSQGCSNRVRPRLPVGEDRLRLAGPPSLHLARHAACEQGRERFRSNQPVERRSLATLHARRDGKIDSESGDDAVVASLQEDSRQLAAPEQQIVRPFQHQRSTGRHHVGRIDQRNAGGQRQQLRRRVVRPCDDEGASEEVSLERLPLPSLAASPRVLGQCDQPIAFGRIRVRKQVGIGRAGTLDDPDTAQKSDPAARSARLPSGPIRR